MPIYPEPKPATTNGTPFRDSFSDAVINTSLWTSTVGAGTISESAGTLTLGSGTTANNTTSLLSNQTFLLPIKVAIGLSLSQRIANQTFFVELVSVDPETGVPDGLETAGLVFDGTTVTQAKHQVRTGGLAVNQSAAQTYPTTASPAKLFEIEASYDETWFHGSAALDSTAGRVNSYRQQLRGPSPHALYKLQLRWLNGATAPASNTNALVTFLSAIEYEELSTEIVNGRGTNVAGAAPAVVVAGGSVAVTGSVTTSGTVTNTQTFPATGGPALFTNNTGAATVVKATAGTIYALTANNTTAAARYVRLFQKATAPTLGTDVPSVVVTLPAGSSKEISLAPGGLTFSSGIGVAVTTDAAQLGSTVATAGDVQLAIAYV